MSGRSQNKMTSEERRKCILQAAKELFSRKGFLGVTTRELAGAVGVTEPVLYEHFSSKRRLYDEILAEESHLKISEFRKLLKPHEDARDDFAYFYEAGRFLMARSHEDPAKLRFLLQVLLEGGEPARLFYENQSVPTHEHLRQYIDLRIEEGAFLPVDARVAARQFMGFVIYHSTLQKLLTDTFLNAAPEVVLEEFVRNFLRGMQCASASGS